LNNTKNRLRDNTDEHIRMTIIKKRQ